MKKMIIVCIFLFRCSLSLAMYYEPWVNVTGLFLKKEKDIQHIVKAGAIQIPLVALYQKNYGSSNFFLVLVYPEDEQNKEYYTDFNDPTYQSFQKLSSQFYTCIGGFIASCYVISCQYKKNHFNTPSLLALLMHQLKKKEGTVVVYAFGESAHVVNLATDIYDKKLAQTNRQDAIDALIYVQSPIYEYSWSLLKQKYESNKEWQPFCFKKLYHLYTKAKLPLYNTLTYPDRKYRQQYTENIIFDDSLPVKNIRMLKEDKNNQLVDMSVEEIKSDILIQNILLILQEVEKYKVNFDFIAKGYNEKDKRERLQVMINRPVQLEQYGDLVFKYGDKKDQLYVFGTTTRSRYFRELFNYEYYTLSKNSLDNMKKFQHNKDITRLTNDHTKS